jgi:signal transduction histidine kinase
VITTENETRQTEVREVAAPTDQLRATLDSLLDPHLLVRPVRDSQGRPRDFVCFEANEAAMAHLGRVREDVVGARLADLLPATLHADLMERLVVTLETGQPLVLEDHAAAPDPLEPERRFDLRVIRIGHALSCTWSDVTQRHEIEASLRRRVTELDVMHRISQALAVRTDLGEALDLARREVARLFGASSAAVCLLPEEEEEDGVLVASCRAGDLGDEVPPDAGVLVAAALARQAAIEGTCAGDDPSRVLAAPMITRGRAVGVLTIARDGAGAAFRPRDVTVAQSIADSLAAAVENERLHRRERQQAATDERQRLARELHDSATQTIYSANLIAEVLPASWERGREEGRQDTRRLGQLMRTALCEMRTLLYELRPETLEAASLEYLLERLGEALHGQGEAAVEVYVDEAVDLPIDVKLVFYRVAQEALTNVAKHAHATRVRVDVTHEDGRVILAVCDDGRGFDLAQARPGTLGLRSMRERAEGVGGDLEIVSVEGGGTMVTMTWPGSGMDQAAS